MGAKELLMNVVLGGKTTSGFDALAGKISGLGAVMSELSGWAWEFEKKSIKTYKDYETYMLEAQGALTAQYKSQTQLARVMEGMHDSAQDWAASTIFGTEDVAKAISEAAHAGWSYEEMLSGIPQAMLLAQAGNLDLSTALDYVIKALNSTKTPFDEAGTLIDQWVMAANSGATTIGELGEAILRMGATARFAESNAELLTMLGLLANMGTVGSEAGTLVRNSMIRLIAPTETAEKMMASLGVTYEEAQEIASDEESLKKANKMLEQVGFSAYDSEGKLKPFLETYRDLYAAVNQMTEENKNWVMSTIFPTRTITGALTFLEAAANGYYGLYEQILDSSGYAAEIAEIQTSGLMGSFKALESKWEEFHRRFGETAAPAVEMVAGGLGAIVDVLNSFPDEAFAGMVGGMTTLAGTAPALLTIGGAMRMISYFGIQGTLAMAGIVATGTAIGALMEYNQNQFESAFGDMTLDLQVLGEHVSGLKTVFDTEKEAVSQWSGALAKAQEEYSELSLLLAEDMLTAALTGKTLSQPEQDALFEYGKGIADAALAGIENARASDLTFLDMLFGDMSTDSEKDAFQDSVGWTNTYYDGLYAEAYSIGEKIREQMTAALQDGTLNESERQAIQDSVDRLNQIQAEINKQLSMEEYYTQLYKAQRVSWDSVDDYMEILAQKQQEKLTETEELYADLWGHQRAAYEYSMQHATTQAERDQAELDWNNFAANFEEERQAKMDEITAQYSELGFKAFETLMYDAGHRIAWDYMMQLAEAGLFTADENGNIPTIDYGAYLPDEMTYNEMGQWLSGMSDLIVKMDGKMPYFNGDGFAQIERMMDGTHMVAEKFSNFAAEEAFWEAIPEVVNKRYEDVVNEISENEERLRDISKRPWYYQLISGETMDYQALHGNVVGGNLYEIKAGLERDIAEMNAELGIAGGAAVNEGAKEGFGELLLAAQMDEAAMVEEAAAAGASAADAVVDGFGHPVLTATVQYVGVQSFGGGTGSKGGGNAHANQNRMTMYAEGGRATEASIFGEAGAEWAIPEEYSQRTADLLNAAREASGFTWGDLIGRTGGLNADAHHVTTQLTYAPVIHAQDAAGVEAVLMRDKERLMALLREMNEEKALRDDVEVYV